MEVAGKVVVVTGGGSGIGRALALRFAQEGAKAVVVADRDGESASAVASHFGGDGVTTNVAIEAEIQKLVDGAVKKHGQIDLFCSNAGVITLGGEEAPDA